MSYTRDQLLACEGAIIPDLIGDNCRLLFVGINPGLQTAMTGIHFAHPSNRFWPALQKAGLIDWAPNVSPETPAVGVDIDVQHRTAVTLTLPRIDWTFDIDVGMTDAQRDDLTRVGIGITNLVQRATSRASELGRDELRTGGQRLMSLVESLRPVVVAVAGVTAYRDAFENRKAALGKQHEGIGPAQLWVVPNPSGLNAHETIESLADWYGLVAAEAGIA
jgi:TDG/mug DNA glycosylase family protein